MSKPTLKSLFESLQTAMIARAAFSEKVEHPVDKGNNAEECWIDWFRTYLPKRYHADKATIIDCHGNTSDQIDIVLYDGQYSYLAFNQSNILYLPAESVYAVFEVKQSLNKANLDYAAAKAASVRKLHRTSDSIPYAAGVYDPKPPHRILSGILTTDIEWKQAFGSSFKKTLLSFDDQQQVDCVCALKAGAFHYNYIQKLLRTSSAEESLVWFFLELLIILKKMGTVPAIDLKEYMNILSTREEFL